MLAVTDARGGTTGRSPLQSGPTKRSLGAFVGGFKSAITKRIGELRGLPRTPV
jgi:REP-associated tyrosine transposase